MLQHPIWGSDSSLAVSFDEVLGLVERGVALVLELVRVVEETRVILESMVLLAVEESIESDEVSGILGLAIGLRAVVGVTVDFDAHVFFGVGHVLAVIDLVELSLAILDLPSVSSGDVLVLTKVSAEKRTVVSGVILVGEHLGGGSSSEERGALPAESH